MEYVRIEELYTFYLQSKKVNTDSRIEIPEALFFALSGPNFDGNAFAKEALESGKLFKLEFQKEIPERNICIITSRQNPISKAAQKLLDTFDTGA